MRGVGGGIPDHIAVKGQNVYASALLFESDFVKWIF